MKRIGANMDYLKFNFDVSAYRLLGRELITDRVTALFEIVKNSYDANADEVSISFLSFGEGSGNGKIVISDNGIGMNLVDLRNKWMVIGTSSKRRELVSPKPHCRKVSGKKGIGRFAVDLLGSKLTLKTKKEDATDWICLETDWSVYLELEKEQLTIPFETEKKFFTDIRNSYWLEPSSNIADHGTSLEIESLNDEWTEYDIVRVYKELSKLVSPRLKNTNYPFRIKIFSPYKDYNNVYVEPLPIVEFATVAVDLKHNQTRNTQEIVVFDKGELKKVEVPQRKFGLVNFSLYYFDQPSKRLYKEKFNHDIDGVKIYRDGIITTPFAESEANVNKQKDILGLDKRRYSGFFERLNSRDLLGFLEITDEHNSNIKEATNRQDFLDNLEWRELKLFVIEQVQQIEKLLKFEKENVRLNTKSELSKANIDLKTIKQSIVTVKREVSPDARRQLRSIEADLGRLQGTVNKSMRDYAKLEEDSKQKENLYFSLVSLQTYAAMFSHMTKHTIGHVIRDAEYFKNNFPNEKLNERFKMISERVYRELVNLRTGVDFMLKYAQSDTDIEQINLFDLIDNLFNNIYSKEFVSQNISAKVEIKKNLILNYNFKAIEDVFDNLITNSIKALKGCRDKKIKCSSIVEKSQLILFFSDNGIGIQEEDRFRIFDIFFTKTSDDGGAGIGLFMVKTRIEAMQGSIEVVESEFKPSGATFKITLPFNKELV